MMLGKVLSEVKEEKDPRGIISTDLKAAKQSIAAS